MTASAPRPSQKRSGRRSWAHPFGELLANLPASGRAPGRADPRRNRRTARRSPPASKLAGLRRRWPRSPANPANPWPPKLASRRGNHLQRRWSRPPPPPKTTRLTTKMGHPPAQIPARAANALGSCLGCGRRTGTFGRDALPGHQTARARCNGRISQRAHREYGRGYSAPPARFAPGPGRSRRRCGPARCTRLECRGLARQALCWELGPASSDQPRMEPGRWASTRSVRPERAGPQMLTRLRRPLVAAGQSHELRCQPDAAP